jgi:hypothetical protein
VPDQSSFPFRRDSATKKFDGSSLPFRHQGTGRSLPQPYPLFAPSGALIDVDLLPRDSPRMAIEDQNRRLRVRRGMSIMKSPCWQSPRFILYVVRGSQSHPPTLQGRWAPCLQEGQKTTNRSNTFFFSYLTWSRCRRSGQIGVLSTYIGVALRIGIGHEPLAFPRNSGRQQPTRLDSNVQSWQQPPLTSVPHFAPRPSLGTRELTASFERAQFFFSFTVNNVVVYFQLAPVYLVDVFRAPYHRRGKKTGGPFRSPQ